MPDPVTVTELRRARLATEEALGRHYRARQDLAALELRERNAVRHGNADAAARIERERAAKAADVARLVAELDAARLREQERAADWVRAVEDPFADLPTDSRLAMLPVRLETRFLPDAAGQDELLIRIFPDDIHVDAHEPELTARERQAGAAYQAAVGTADVDARRTAWAALAGEFGAPRAAWVVARTAANAGTDPGDRADDWTRGASTTVLPDRWLVAGFTDGAEAFRAWGNPVPDRVQVGPDPDAAETDGDEQGFGTVDPALRWVEDFAAAEAIGLGIRVPAAQLPASGRIELLLALGVKATLDADASRDRLAGVLSAHRHTDDMGFIPRGTPTNNTEDRRAGYDSRDAAFEKSFAVQEASAIPPAEGSNAANLAAALNLNATQAQVLAGLEAASEPDRAEAEAMISALWPVTWWYYLKEMMASEVADADIGFARTFFTGWVRPGGWLASLRLGQQPYAVWAVTDLARWQPSSHREDAGRLSRLHKLLSSLRAHWRQALPRVPRTDALNAGGDPAAALLEVLGMDGVSRRHYARAADGEFFLFNLAGFGGTALGGADLDSLQLTPEVGGLVTEVAAPPSLDFWNPLLRRISFDEGTLRLNGPRVSSSGKTPDDYITWMLQAGPDALADEQPYAGHKMPLLYLLLRHAGRLEYGRTALKLGIDEAVFADLGTHEPVMVNFAGAPSRTYTSVMSEAPPAVTGGLTFAEHLGRFRDAYRARDAQFNAFWDALDRLRALDVSRLDMLLRETLDLSAHRLDAILGGMANQRLDDLAETSAPGPFIGGFGWVENLSKSAAPRSEGRVLAPGIDHAGAAAVLRSGHLAHRKSANPSAMAVSLSSVRVRAAGEVLDGVAGGLPLGAVLGYHFERMLHEHPLAPALDRYILPFRERVPLAGLPGADPQVAIAQTVDGYRLHQHHGAGTLSLDFIQTEHRGAVRAVLDELGHRIDAVGDALLAESMFQTVRGNRDRTRATLDGIAQGEGDVPKLDFARTSRRAVAFRHRVAIALPETSQGWDAHAGQIRRRAEPRLDAWLAGQLPLPASVGVTASASARSWPVPLTALRLSPLDLFHMSVTGHEAGSELHARFLAAARNLAPDGLQAAEIAIDFDTDPGAGLSVPFARFARQLSALHDAVESARRLGPGDLAAGDAPAAEGWLTGELKLRVDTVATDLRDLRNEIVLALATATVQSLTTQLWRLRAFGLEQTLPESTSADPLREQMDRALDVAAAVLARHDAAVSGFDRPNAGAAEQVAHDMARARILLGEAFLAVPQFVPADPDELSAAIAASPDILGADAASTLPLHRWLSSHARVQPALGKLNDALNGADRLRGASTTWLTALQFPVEANARWCGLPLEGAAAESYANKVSVVVLGDLPANGGIAGLSIDAWTESLPLDTVDGAVAFHLDQPAAQAPNAVLLAVPPRLGEPWTADRMIAVLRDTLDLSKIRTVDNTALETLGQYLPAILLAANEADETVSTDITRATFPLVVSVPLMDVFSEVTPT